VAGPAIEAALAAFKALPIKLISQDELRASLRDLDVRRGVPSESGRYLREGREQHLGLKLDQAVESYRKAITVLENGFVRFYDPGMLAEPILQLGAALYQSDQKEEAHRAFMRVAALAPALELSEGYYSPSVREAYQLAKADLGALQPGIPSPLALGRMCYAADLAGMVVISVERLGDRPLLRVGLFEASRQGFAAMETGVIDEKNATSVGSALAERLSRRLAVMAGVALDTDLDGGVDDGGAGGGADGDAVPDGDGGLPSAADAGLPLTADPGLGPIDETPWYWKHWWIWPVAAGVIAAAVALPLTVFRKDVVDVQVYH
jgi:hypothetical protein